MDIEDVDFESDNYQHPDVLDVYLFSSDPKLNEVTEKIFKEVGFKGQKKLIKDQLRVLILNFIKLKKRKKNGFLRYSRRNDFWTGHDRKMPNPWGVSRKMDDVIDGLHEMGLLQYQKGFAAENLKRQSRIAPSAKFSRKYIKPFMLLDIPLEYHQEYPLVHIHLKDYSKHTKEITHVRYEAKGTTAIPYQHKRTKEQLRRYNNLLKNTPITLDKVPETKDAPKIDFGLQKQVYRVYSDKKASKGGRLYGAWWHHLAKRHHRPFILINGNKTVELDYRSQHAYMAYGLALGRPMGVVLNGMDPYEVPKPDSTETYPRAIGKGIFTRALNSKRGPHLKSSLGKQFMADLESSNPEDRLTAQKCLPFIQNDFDAYLDAFEEHHKALLKPKRFLFPHKKENKLWGSFQFNDSQICLYVLDKLTQQGIPCLSLHDSFVVEEQNEEILKGLMKEAYLKAEDIPDLSQCIPEIKTTRRKTP
jgi:hypothetical protein